MRNGKKQEEETVAKNIPFRTEPGISKSHFDNGCVIAQKTMLLVGFDPVFFDMLSKRQKHILLDFEEYQPVFRAKEGNRVPRRYLAGIRETMMEFMRREYIDEKIRLTYLDFATYGISFIFSFQMNYKYGIFTDEQKEAFADEMSNKIEKFDFVGSQSFKKMYDVLRFELNFYSQMNFRIYGFEFHIEIFKPKEIAGQSNLRYLLKLTSHENESMHFTHNDASYKAYRLIAGGRHSSNTCPYIIMNHKELYPGSKLKKEYGMYILSHAIHHFKEHIDNVDALLRNYILNSSMTDNRKVIRCANGQSFICCVIRNFVTGYFTYTVQDDKLFILSFLPLTSRLVPEGEKLCRVLNLGEDELAYLGMDKLSFYATVNFDEIPVLKNALMESGIWKAKIAVDESTIYEKLKIDKEKTQFVKNFFEKTETRKIQFSIEK
ncbi:MAG: hypothetical protein LBK97_08095 [Prevotellaceae bacterium]|nr:hypothetical protein [Prevotellaceae bacterium]